MYMTILVWDCPSNHPWNPRLKMENLVRILACLLPIIKWLVFQYFNSFSPTGFFNALLGDHVMVSNPVLFDVGWTHDAKLENLHEERNTFKNDEDYFEIIPRQKWALG